MTDSYKIGQERAADGNATVITVSGELDISARDDLLAQIRTALDGGDVVVDLGGVSFLDSEALGALIEGYNAARSRDADFRVIHARGLVERVLAVSGTLELFGP